MNKDISKMETPPSSPQAASPKKYCGTESATPSTPMSAEDCNHASPARPNSSFASNNQGGTASRVFGCYQAAPITDLGTPVISNSAGYVDARMSPGFTASLQLDSDSDDDFVAARTPMTRGLKQRLSRGNFKESEGGHLLLGERLSMPSYNSDEFFSLGTSSGSGQMVTRSNVMGEPEVCGAVSVVKRNEYPKLAAPIELKPDRKFFSFQCAGQYKQQTEAIPPSSLLSDPVKNQQYHPMLRSQHGVREMADAQDLDTIFKAPRKAPAKAVTPDREMPQPHLSQPYPVEDREWSIPSIRLANHVRGHPMDSFASYADFSEYTTEDDLDGSLCSLLDDDDSSLDLSIRSARGARIRRYSGIFQRKPSSGASAYVPQTIYSQDAGDALLPGPPSVVSPLAPPQLMIAPSNSLLERMQVVSVEDATKHNVPTLSDAEGPRPRKQHRGSRHGKEGAAREWLRDLQAKSRDVSIAEAASSKFLGPDGGNPGQRPRSASPDDVSGGAGDATKALGMPHPLCRSSTIGAGPLAANRWAQAGGGVHDARKSGDEPVEFGKSASVLPHLHGVGVRAV